MNIIKSLRFSTLCNPFLIWFVISTIYLTLIFTFLINAPLRADEKHIIETIKLFRETDLIHVIKDYPQVTPPLFYITLAIWTKLLGFNIITQRLFIILIAFISFQLIFYLLQYSLKRVLMSVMLSLLILINPYFIGLSIFIYTDMLMILFILLAILFIMKNRLWLFCIFSALAILVRHYAVILPMSVFVYAFIRKFIFRENIKKLLITSSISVMPLFILFFFWRGFAPQSGIQRWMIENETFYNLSYINSYLTFSFIYLLPLTFYYLIKKVKQKINENSSKIDSANVSTKFILKFYILIKRNWALVLVALLLTVILSFFPVEVSKVTLIQTDTKTIGLVHKILVIFLGDGVILRSVFIMVLFLSILFNIILIKNYLVEIKAKNVDYHLLLIIMWIIFLLIMPLSYQIWEKYLTMIIPSLVIGTSKKLFVP